MLGTEHYANILAMTLILAAILASLSAPAEAKTAPVTVSYDLAIGGNQSIKTLSAGVVRRHALMSEGRVLLGYGARASLMAGSLELAPARKDMGPSRLTIDSARLALLNLNIHAALKVADPVEVGFNLDVAGATAGSSEDASYRPTPTSGAVRLTAVPARGNLFLYGANDRGSLNSEFYAAWRLNPKFTLRGGLSHLLAEYRADQDLGSGTRRFRRFSNLFFLSLRWTPGS